MNPEWYCLTPHGRYHLTDRYLGDFQPGFGLGATYKVPVSVCGVSGFVPEDMEPDPNPPAQKRCLKCERKRRYRIAISEAEEAK